MVAISLYRGNLHRVPDVPRRWLMPKPTISLKDFRSLIHKRNKTLSPITTTINPNPNPNPNSESIKKEEEELVVVKEENGGSKQTPLPTTEPPHAQSQDNDNNLVEDAPSQQQQQQQQQEEKEDHRMAESAEDQTGLNTDSILEQPRETTESVPAPDIKCEVPETADDLKNGGDGGNSQVLEREPAAVEILNAEEEMKRRNSMQASVARPPVPLQVEVTGDGGNSQVLEKEPAAVEISKNVDLPSDKEKEKKELEEKLQILNEKKHNLVQMLKQILNAEEEMKRQNSMQATVARPAVSLQVEVTADFGSSPRQAATRMGSEANCSGDLEGESEDASNHHAHARHLHQIHSPSASSPFRRTGHSSFQHHSVPHTTRASGASGSGRTQSPSSLSMGVIASPSPSRFAPTGTQGHHASLPPPVSLSGTHFMASSPSPAASGGTSVFRDARLTSPSWN